MKLKKCLALFLALCMTLPMLPTIARAEEIDSGTCGDNLTWVLDTSGTLTISGSGAMTEYASFASVPWDACREIITSVVMADSVTTIGAYAFYECLNLPGITLPVGITAIGTGAFEYCRGMTGITIPGSVTVIGANAFRECSSLTEIVFTGDAPTIHDTAFSNITATVSYPMDNATWTQDMIQNYGGDMTWGTGESAQKPVTLIDKGTYGDNLTWTLAADGTLTISGSGNMVDYASFADIPWGAYCEIISSVVMGDGITSIGAYAFYECTNLSSVDIPSGVAVIGEGAFEYCYSLTEITVPSNVTAIGDYAFHNCGKLAKIVFAGSAPAIAANAFCNVAANVLYPTDDASWSADVKRNYGGSLTWGVDGEPSQDPVETISGGTCGDNLTWSLTEDGTLTISGSGDMAEFATYYSVPWDPYREIITAVVMEEGITSISAYAFYECLNLPNVTIPSGVTAIGASAFEYCPGLTEIIFEGSAPKFDENAFCNVIATARYPLGDKSWTSDIMQNYGGSITWYPYGEEAPETMLGDVNSDGEIDIFDANLIVAYYNETIDFTMNQILAADVNGDGEVDIFDANLIVAYYNETIDTFPAA